MVSGASGVVLSCFSFPLRQRRLLVRQYLQKRKTAACYGISENGVTSTGPSENAVHCVHTRYESSTRRFGNLLRQKTTSIGWGVAVVDGRAIAREILSWRERRAATTVNRQ